MEYPFYISSVIFAMVFKTSLQALVHEDAGGNPKPPLHAHLGAGAADGGIDEVAKEEIHDYERRHRDPGSVWVLAIQKLICQKSFKMLLLVAVGVV